MIVIVMGVVMGVVMVMDLVGKFYVFMIVYLYIFIGNG